MVYKAYKDECYIIGICLPNDTETTALRMKQYFDGYLDISPEEKAEFDKVDAEFWKWQELLQKRYKKA